MQQIPFRDQILCISIGKLSTIFNLVNDSIIMADPGDTQTLNIGVYTPDDDDGKLSSKESERGEACDAGDSVSVTVTECSKKEEEEEEVIEESLSGEDTMFEETIPQPDSTT